MIKFKALGPRIKLKMLEEGEERSSIGIVLSQGIKPEDSTHGVVVELGHTAYKGLRDDEPWCKVGDHVQIMRYAGTGFREEDGYYRLIKDIDVLAVGEE